MNYLQRIDRYFRSYLQHFPFIFILLFCFTSLQVLAIDSFTVSNKEGNLEFLPPAGHHFNVEAPSKIIMGSKKIPVQVEAPKFIWNSKTAGLDKLSIDQVITAELFVCDDKNTYCIKQTQSLKIQDANTILILSPLPKSTTTKSNTVEQNTESNHATDTQFILNDSQEAFELAKKENKLVFIDFFGIWCPPCNVMDESVFNTPEFQSLNKEYIFLKMDVDDEISKGLRTKYSIKAFPTMIIANANEEEITRIVGSRKPKGFIKLLKASIKYKGQSLTDRIHKSQLNDKSGQYAYDLGMMYLAQEDFPQALQYLSLANLKWSTKDVRKNDLLSAQLGVLSLLTDEKNRRVYAETLMAAIQAFPKTVQAYERSSSLINIAEELKDEKLIAIANQKLLSVCLELLKSPSVLENDELTKADLLGTLADIYEQQKNLDLAKKYYRQAYEAVSTEIKSKGLDENTNRGLNLDRLYYLYKSGEHNLANEKYEILQKKYPHEFTFYYRQAQLLKDIKKSDEALIKVNEALKYSYGENKLKVVALKANILLELTKNQEAIELIDQTIQALKPNEDKATKPNRNIERLQQIKEKAMKASSSK